MPARSASVSRARGAHEEEAGVSAVRQLFRQQVLEKRILIDRMPDLFDFDGSDNSRPEHECIELPYRIGVFYPVISHFLCTALCFFNGF